MTRGIDLDQEDFTQRVKRKNQSNLTLLWFVKPSNRDEIG